MIPTTLSCVDILTIVGGWWPRRIPIFTMGGNVINAEPSFYSGSYWVLWHRCLVVSHWFGKGFGSKVYSKSNKNDSRSHPFTEKFDFFTHSPGKSYFVPVRSLTTLQNLLPFTSAHMEYCTTHARLSYFTPDPGHVSLLL